MQYGGYAESESGVPRAGKGRQGGKYKRDRTQWVGRGWDAVCSKERFAAYPEHCSQLNDRLTVLMADPNWNRGFYYDGVPPHNGMKLARRMALSLLALS